MRTAILALALAAALAPAATRAAEPAPYTVDVEVTRGGRTVSASVEAPAGGSGASTRERSLPYPASLASADPDEVPALATVVVTDSFRVVPVERDGGLAVTAEVSLSRLRGLRRVEDAGRAVELPDVETVRIALADVALRPEGGAWTYEGDDAGTGSHLRIVARR